MTDTHSPVDARTLRETAHRAVTEGVNLAYVEQMRQALYKAADLIDALMESEAEWQRRRDRSLAAEQRAEALVEFAEFVVSLDDVEMRRSITLTKLILMARKATGERP